MTDRQDFAIVFWPAAFFSLFRNDVSRKQLKNKASVWIDFKNSFAWFTGMNQIICYISHFFCSGPFLVLFEDLMDRKNGRSQKICKSKKSVFSWPSTSEGLFEICSDWGLIFTTACPNFEQLFPSFGKFFQNNFWLKSLQMVSSLTGLMPLENRQS